MEKGHKTNELETLGGRLRAALVASGKRQRDIAAHFKVTEQAVSQWFRNETAPDRTKLFDLAKLLSVRAEWLLDGTPPQHLTKPEQEPLNTPVINIQHMTRDVPILGGAACGEDGLFEMNGQALDHARRPPRLQNVKDAYAVFVQGLSMSPWREPGELVYVHPHQPIRVGDYVVVQLHPEGPGDPPKAYIKRFVRKSPEKLILCQYNPPEEKTIPMKKVKSIHKVIDWSELMGL